MIYDSHKKTISVSLVVYTNQESNYRIPVNIYLNIICIFVGNPNQKYNNSQGEKRIYHELARMVLQMKYMRW